MDNEIDKGLQDLIIGIIKIANAGAFESYARNDSLHVYDYDVVAVRAWKIVHLVYGTASLLYAGVGMDYLGRLLSRMADDGVIGCILSENNEPFYYLLPEQMEEQE